VIGIEAVATISHDMAGKMQESFGKDKKKGGSRNGIKELHMHKPMDRYIRQRGSKG
jgi:hypothetical protein